MAQAEQRDGVTSTEAVHNYHGKDRCGPPLLCMYSRQQHATGNAGTLIPSPYKDTRRLVRSTHLYCHVPLPRPCPSLVGRLLYALNFGQLSC